MVVKRAPIDLMEAIVRSFATTDRVTRFLVENLSDELWSAVRPGGRGKTIRGLITHIHNVRCMWLKMLGRRAKVNPPARLDRRTATQQEALEALEVSCGAVLQLLRFGIDEGGKVPGFPPDVVHLLCYLTAHEAHHRGQVCLLARQAGRPLPAEVNIGLWQWSKRAMEG